MSHEVLSDFHELGPLRERSRKRTFTPMFQLQHKHTAKIYSSTVLTADSSQTAPINVGHLVEVVQKVEDGDVAREKCRQIVLLLLGLRRFRKSILSSNMYDVTRCIAVIVWATRATRVWGNQLPSLFVAPVHWVLHDAQSNEWHVITGDVTENGGKQDLMKLACLRDEEVVRFYLAEIVLALECLHANGLVADLKPEGLWVTSDGHVYLTDYLMRRFGAGVKSWKMS
jgi:hypothetical protein